MPPLKLSPFIINNDTANNLYSQVNFNDPELMQNPESLLQATKKGKTLMVFVKVCIKVVILCIFGLLKLEDNI